jgi:hypothetical protein
VAELAVSREDDMRVPMLLHAFLHAVLVLVTGVPTTIILWLAGQADFPLVEQMLSNTVIVGGIGRVLAGSFWRVVDFLRGMGQLPHNMDEFTDRMSGVLGFVFFVLGIVVPLVTWRAVENNL